MREIIPVVAACIVSPSPYPLRILMHKKDEPRNPELLGKWEFPGGMVDYGESPEQALTRELREELGREFAIVKLLHAQTNIYRDGIHYLVLFYECLWHHAPIPAGCQWFSPGEVLMADCLPGTHEVIARMIKGYTTDERRKV